MDKYVAKALIDLAIFFETADDEVLHPDTAMQALEQLGANLQAADSATRQELAVLFRSLAPDYPTDRQFVGDLPESLGIA